MSEQSTRLSRVDYRSQKTRASSLMVLVETLKDGSPKSTILWILKPKITKNYRSRSYTRATHALLFSIGEQETVAEPIRFADFQQNTAEFLLMLNKISCCFDAVEKSANYLIQKTAKHCRRASRQASGLTHSVPVPVHCRTWVVWCTIYDNITLKAQNKFSLRFIFFPAFFKRYEYLASACEQLFTLFSTANFS